MSQSDNFYVDELLKAEEEANKTIKAAQKQRQFGGQVYDDLQRKLKEAKAAAEQEIESFKDKKESEYKQLQQRKEDKKFEQDLKRQTDQEIKKIHEDFERNKSKVIQMLIDNVLNVDLEIPINIKQKFTARQGLQ